MNAGQYDTPIEIWEVEYGVDDFGMPVETWSIADNSPRWGRLEPIKGLTRVEVQKVTTTLQDKLTIRRWADLDPTHEIKIDGQMHKIESIEDYKRRGYQVLWIKKKV